jgi:hypothetical protein
VSQILRLINSISYQVYELKKKKKVRSLYRCEYRLLAVTPIPSYDTVMCAIVIKNTVVNKTVYNDIIQ